MEIKTGKRGMVKEDNVHRKWMEEPEVLFSVDSGIKFAWDLTVTENEDIVAVHGSTIQVYSSDGQQKERIYCSQLQNAWNVVAKGDTLYVSDQEANGNVLVMDVKGNVKKIITLPETDQNYSHKGLAVDDEGNVYISSRKTNTIYKCQHNETSAEVFIQQGTHPDLRGPWYLCITPSSELVVSNFGSLSLQVYDRSGEFLWQYKGHGDMTLGHAWGVCCDRECYIYITDCGMSRVQVIKDGDFQNCVNYKSRYGIALDKEDNLVWCYNNRITKLKIWQ